MHVQKDIVLILALLDRWRYWVNDLNDNAPQ